MSAYNLLTISGQSMTLDEIHSQLESLQHPGTGVEQMKVALAEIERRKLIHTDGDRYRGNDPTRRTVTHRDQTDTAVDPKTGEVTGGWNGWMVRDRQRGLVPIAEVIRAAQETN